jgi:hypothetical protein
VEGLQVYEVVGPGQRVELEFDQAVAREFGFRLGELGLVGDPEPVAQDTGLQVEVGVPAHLR